MLSEGSSPGEITLYLLRCEIKKVLGKWQSGLSKDKLFTGNRASSNQFTFTQHLATIYDMPMQRKAEPKKKKASHEKNSAKPFPWVICSIIKRLVPGRDLLEEMCSLQTHCKYGQRTSLSVKRKTTTTKNRYVTHLLKLDSASHQGCGRSTASAAHARGAKRAQGPGPGTLRAGHPAAKWVLESTNWLPRFVLQGRDLDLP